MSSTCEPLPAPPHRTKGLESGQNLNPFKSEGSIVQEDLLLIPLESHPECWIEEDRFLTLPPVSLTVNSKNLFFLKS